MNTNRVVFICISPSTDRTLVFTYDQLDGGFDCGFYFSAFTDRKVPREERIQVLRERSNKKDLEKYSFVVMSKYFVKKFIICLLN